MNPEIPAAFVAAIAPRYAVQCELGQGGMATVYLAEDLRHNRPVALKVMKPELAQAVGAERFLREIAVMARLSHPGILGLLDSGEAAGMLFYVMPYIAGESVRDRIEREGALPLDDAIAIAADVADALEYAHASGVVHRDITPANIMLDHGRARVADFGIAHVMSGEADKLTLTGVAVGSPSYMSPEQAGGSAHVDARSDVYSLGCVLFEMLAGHPPFTGATVDSVLRQHALAPLPSIAAIRPAVPSHVVRSIAKATAKTPADRFPSTRAFANDLKRTAPSPELGRRAAMWRWAVPVSAAFVAAVALAVHSVGARRGDPSSLAVLPLTATGDSAEAAAYIADGITESIITRLSSTGTIRVVPWLTVAQFRGSTRSAAAIAVEAGADRVLTGTLRRVNDRIRVTVALIDATTGLQVWGDEFDEARGDILAMEGRIARETARRVGLGLSGSVTALLETSPTQSSEAYDLYLRGKAMLTRPDSLANRVAAALFAQAIVLDSALAEAHVGLGTTEWNRYYYAWQGDSSNLARAEALLLRATQLNPRLVDAYGELTRVRWLQGRLEDVLRLLPVLRSLGETDVPSLLAQAHALYFADFMDEATALYRRVVELDPANALARSRIAGSLALGGRFDEARAAEAEADRRGLSSARAKLYVGQSAAFVGKLDYADSLIAVAAQMAPDDFVIHFMHGVVRKRRGDRSGATASWATTLRLLEGQPAGNARNRHYQRFALAHMGDRRAALAGESQAESEGMAPQDLLAWGRIHGILGNLDRSVEYFRRSLAVGLRWSYDVSFYSYGHDRLASYPPFVQLSAELAAERERLRRLYVVGPE